MNNKQRKIKNIEFDGENLHFDLRISIPRSQISTELIYDLSEIKDKLINGYFDPYNNKVWMEHTCRVEQDENGNDVFKIEKTAKELL